MPKLASAVQLLGALLTVAALVLGVAVWAGLLALGVWLVVFGVALERS